MSLFIDYLAELGLDLGKDYLIDRKRDEDIKKCLKDYLKRQSNTNELCNLAEEIDFQGLAQYISENLLMDAKVYLFGQKADREMMKNTILSKAFAYSNAKDKLQKDRVETLLNGSLEILYNFYRNQTANSDWFVAAEIIDTIIHEFKTELKKQQEEISANDPIPRILTELAPRPPIDEQLISREDETASILELIDKENKLVLVNGLGGVGKSTVCKELFYYLKNNDANSRKLAWVTYNGKSLFDDFVDQFYYPERFTERKEKIKYFLQTGIDQDAIIFVDNLNARDVEEPFIQVLERARCNVVCTSRVTDYKYFKIVPVTLFDLEKCIKLYKGYAGIPEQNTGYDDFIEQIVKRVGLHTLTIEILGKITAAEELNPEKLLEQLTVKGINLEGTVEVDLKEDTLIGHLCKIFPVDKLNKEQKYILAHFANCPLEQIPKN